MAKSNAALVIVESPAKAKTIEKYLGKDYKVTASMGHLRDLPKSTMGVDIEGGFIPDYQPIKGREEKIEELREAAKKASIVYLATDPDREGEAISWHLKELLDLPDDKTRRVTFNEITKKVVTESISHPRAIDMDLVDAQQARRILDRIVGYQLSPMLWTKIKRGLSAGRVQSVATRMVVDRENEIRAFVPEEYWLLDVLLACGEGEDERFTAHYYGMNGKKRELHSADEVAEVESAVRTAPFSISAVRRTDRQRSPSAPFITSTLQQEASRKLNMTPRRTMSIAQMLYEGVNIEDVGTVGLITYMRTDSLRISLEAQAAARSFIQENYGDSYCPAAPRVYKTKKEAQDAHEAIRPSDVYLTPERVRKDLTPEQYRLYKLIWNRFMASQMANVVYDSVSIDAVSAGHMFRATHSAIKFPGFTRVYDSGEDEPNLKQRPLPALREGQEVSLQNIVKEQKFTQPPARYTEDTLIRAMEEKGIGRPSTYAPTMSTILDREYVVKEGKALKPTALGETVTKFMTERFENIVDVTFTAKMEETLDEVEEGKKEWKSVLEEFYADFAKALGDAEEALKGVRIKVPDEVTDEKCDVCGRNMVIKSGRFGRFLACPGFPECTFTKPIVIEMPGQCPKCGGRILKRTSKKGYAYYACEKGADCGFMTWDVPVKDNCPECGHTMFKKSGRGFKKPFCINENCSNFLPEDKRGYPKKKAAEGEAAEPAAEAEKKAEKPAAKKTTAKKSTAGKTAAKKTAKKSEAEDK
ncbi:MAG: type I DNA topoisomerase [Clostridiales bacterium]|nr:type I DNA topoisomerase [Clostridiales bacterium]